MISVCSVGDDGPSSASLGQKRCPLLRLCFGSSPAFICECHQARRPVGEWNVYRISLPEDLDSFRTTLLSLLVAIPPLPSFLLCSLACSRWRAWVQVAIRNVRRDAIKSYEKLQKVREMPAVPTGLRTTIRKELL